METNQIFTTPGDLGIDIVNMDYTNPFNFSKFFNSFSKYCSKERFVYLLIGFILLISIYFYLQYKKTLKIDTDEPLPSNSDIEPNVDGSFKPPDGYVTIPTDTYQHLQESFNQTNSIDSPQMEQMEQMDSPQMEQMNMNLSDNDIDVTDDMQKQDFLSNDHSSLINNMAHINSTEEDQRVQDQDLTNTEIQNIQQQLNSLNSL